MIFLPQCPALSIINGRSHSHVELAEFHVYGKLHVQCLVESQFNWAMSVSHPTLEQSAL